ncbi:MAG: response regulator, partial [Acidobacteria bacterium]|nr:response regulator [Acidobacteriota bacterium]
ALAGVWSWDGASFRWSPKCARLHGRADVDSLTLDTWLEAVAPKDRAKVTDRLGAALARGLPVELEYEVTREDGAKRWLLCTGRLIEPALGHRRALGMVFDITEARRTANEALRSMQEFRTIFETAAVGVAQVDARRQTFVRVNRRYCEQVGRTAEELQALTVRDVTHPDDREADAQRCAPVLRGEVDEWTSEKRFLRPDGTICWALVNGALVRDEDGAPLRSISVVQDITQRKRGEQLLAFLAEAGRVLSTLEDPESGLRKLAARATELVCELCVIELADGDRWPQLAVSSVRRPDNAAATPDDPLVRGAIDRAVQSGDAELCAETGLEGRLRSFVCVPLLAHGRALGAVLLGSDEPRAFGGRELSGAEEFARIASVALENARLYSEVRESDRAKDEFLAILAHELRNPLAAIAGAVDVLESPVSATRLPWIQQALRRQTRHLARMLDDLLDVARITKGIIRLRRERVSLAQVIHDALDEVRPLMQERRHQLVVGIANGSLDVFGDRARLLQMLVNLLTNAAKYTDPGGTVTIEARRSGESVVVAVRDSGIGIPPEMLGRVFQFFVQAHAPAVDRSRGGLGIGLALVRRLAELHGGTVEALSEGAGRGSEFRLALPALAEAAREVPAPAPAELALPPGLRVAVVDDNRDLAQALATALAAGGAEVLVAHDGRAGLELICRERPDAALVDIGLPGIDGCELARRLRRDPALAGLRLVAISGYGQPRDSERSLAAGFDAHLVKPVELGRLMEILRRCASHPARRILVVEDNPTLALMVQLRLEQAGHEVSVVHDGEAAVAECRRWRPEVVICDLRLPGRLDGLAVARALRADPACAGTFLVAVSGADLAEFESSARAAGFEECLRKPVDPERLLAVVRRSQEAAAEDRAASG